MTKILKSSNPMVLDLSGCHLISTKNQPIQDLNVRKAIMHGTNLDKIVDLVYQGYAKKADSFIYPEMDNYNPNLPKYDFSPGKSQTNPGQRRICRQRQ